MMANIIVFKTTQLPTNRKFGWFFASIFTFIAIYTCWKQYNVFAASALILSVLFTAVTIISPQLLSPINRLWYDIGMILGRIISPIVLGTIFFAMITPISLILRIFGRDELKMKKRSLDTYWVDRSPSGPSSDSFKNQY